MDRKQWAEGKTLGFGCMRMPLKEKDDPTSFDYEKIGALFDDFLARGFDYFDTAYTYHGYRAEEAVRKALVERHPRESFRLATKLPLRDFRDAQDMENIFEEQLRNCGVKYFDFYLLHNMGMNVYEKCCRYDAFHFVREKQREGKILHTGMSFHDTPELLEEILQKYGDCLDFLQLQINYADWEQPNVQAKRCLETAVRHGKPVIVMEPCRGGTLANLPEEAEKRMRARRPDDSPASWAFRFAAEQEGVFCVLSGMNAPEQVEENCGVFEHLQPLTQEDYGVLAEVTKILHADTAIECTACEYCTHDCPKSIAIPKYFALYNSAVRAKGGFSSQIAYYNNISLGAGSRAGDCIGCGRCEEACPQHLPIRKYLKDVAEKFENENAFPTRKPEKK